MANVVGRIMDARVAPRYREPRPSDIVVHNDHLSRIFGRILDGLGPNRLSRLSICCHGLMADMTAPNRMLSRLGGGFGLQLGWDNLTLSSAHNFARLRGKFAPGGMIDIYACAAADDSSTTGFTGNGHLLMREIAGQAGAIVRASDAIQVNTRGWQPQPSIFGVARPPLDLGVFMGPWEGNVWIFSPDGSAPRLDAAPGLGER